MSKSLQEVINKAEQDINFGTVTITLKKAHGDVVNVDTTRITKRRVAGNAQALTLIGSMLKLIHESGDTGHLTFTISVNHGEGEYLLTHDFQRLKRIGTEYQ